LFVIVLCVIAKCDCYEVVELSGRCLDLGSYLDFDSCLALDNSLDLDSCIDLENPGLDLDNSLNLENVGLDLDSSLDVEFCLTSTSTAALISGTLVSILTTL
jgi:hypothetical protein